MKFSEMIQRTRELLDINEGNEELDKVLGNCINTAYMTLARDKWRPVKREEAEATDGEIQISKLAEDFVSLKSAYTESGFKLGAWAGKDFIHIPKWTDRAVLEYYFLPKPMTLADDEPIIPETQVDSYAYVYFAVSRYLNVKHRHSEASIWDSAYRNIVDNISEARGCKVMKVQRWT